ncbi:restriction endonuclease subunit S [Bacillus mojavensis]|uniref:restriction endonuclease subunit S n=1 Tax=Bacillus mojavensis TaxID=72360 RepID=UPI002DB96A22|nr:restriction endonuclease subunit S [Bacillus mojavensis]MEC1752058.1 restriction endonuclease subunit S [Bacillus mojavensis]
MTNKRAPEVRFEEFIGDWEQRNLESIYGKIRNAFVGTATPYYVEDGHFYLESNNVKDGQINRNTEVFINDEFYQKQKDNWLHTGDLVMVQSGHVGHTAVIPEELDNTAAHALIMFSNYREKADPYFLNYQFQTHKSKKKLGSITTGNTIKHILASEMKKFLVDIPRYEEQQTIGNFFKLIDDTIALHQQELTTLKQTKQGFLQKMFPKEGESVPEIRFPGFTGDWEQRKFSNIVYRVSKQSNDANLPKVEYEDIISGEGRLNKDISRKFDNRKGIVFEPHYILFGKLRPYLKNWLYPDFKGIALGDFWVFKPNNTSSIFDYYLIQTDKYQTVANLSSGTKMPRSDWKTVSETEFRIPTIEEQNKIGNFFKKLDDTIALHQRELDALKETKKAFLQKMFV